MISIHTKRLGQVSPACSHTDWRSETSGHEKVPSIIQADWSVNQPSTNTISNKGVYKLIW